MPKVTVSVNTEPKCTVLMKQKLAKINLHKNVSGYGGVGYWKLHFAWCLFVVLHCGFGST